MPAHSGRTIVKGADGTYYILSTTDPPQPLAAAQAQELQDAIQDIQGTLESLFAQAMQNVTASCSQTIQIVIPEVDL
jgi:hypothetical protein